MSDDAIHYSIGLFQALGAVLVVWVAYMALKRLRRGRRAHYKVMR